MTTRAIVLVLALSASLAAARAAGAITVGCDQIVGTATSGRDSGYRVVLGVVSAPPADLPGVVHVPGSAPFPYWQKAGLVVRGGRQPVTVTVPRGWRSRVRVGWGNPATPAAVVRFAACPSSHAWNGYAGGFFLRARSACVPLVFAVGGRRATLRFGLGSRCRDDVAQAATGAA